jgi:hypothetical protein
MAVYKNTSGGSLTLPDGKVITSGSTADLSGDETKNVGVKGWVKEGQLVSVAPAKSAKADK